MKTLAIYALEVLACSGVLLAAYAILLDRRVKFRWCRFYLLAATAAAALIPLLRIPVWPGKVITATPMVTAPALPEWTAEVLPDTDAAAFTPEHFCLVAYLLGAGLIIGAMLWQILHIRRLRRGATITRTGRCKIVRTRQEIASFSFFRTIYVWEKTPAQEMAAILAHESSHIAHRHSVERIVMELLKAALWWNPFAWIAARRMTEAEEFEADNDVLTSGYDRAEYMQTIFKQLFGYSPEIANGLRNSLTKKRFKMMTTQTKGRHSLLRLAGTLPALIGLLCAFSFTTRAAVIVAPVADTGIGTTPEQELQATAGDEKQDKTCTVSVTVQNEKKEAIQGAIVQVVGSTQGVVTNADGHAQITVPGGSKLSVTYPNYESEIITTEENAAIESFILLKPTGATGTKVSETATDTKVHVIVNKDSKPLPGALITVKGTPKGVTTDAAGYGEIEVRPKSELEVSYVGCETQVLKVDNWPRETFTVNLRADTSGTPAAAEGKPLWIVNGIEVTPDFINKIDPNQIDNMMILKDQSAIATYGERARNGLIIITTKGDRIAPAISGQTVTNGNGSTTVQAELQGSSIHETGDKGADDPFLIAETMPGFPVGEATPEQQYGNLGDFRQWVQMHVKYPAEALKNNIYGRVVVSFVIEKDGSVSTLETLQSPDKTLADEVYRIIGLAPKWKPGTQRGEPVRVKFTLPIDFAVSTSEGVLRDKTPAKQQGSLDEVVVVGYGTRKK